MGQDNQSGWEWQQMLLDERRWIEDKAVKHAITIDEHLIDAAAKPSRIRVKRDSSYLAQQAQGLFAHKSNRFFVNPTDHQLDKIFRGEL